MNKTQREPWLGLTRVVVEARYVKGHEPLEHPFYKGNLSLCHFCKFARWSGNPCGGDSDMDCTHSLASEERWDPMQVWEGDGQDCWGFRPKVDIDEAADILGIFLRGEWYGHRRSR